MCTARIATHTTTAKFASIQYRERNREVPICGEAIPDHRRICNRLRLSKPVQNVSQVYTVVSGGSVSQSKPAVQMICMIILPSTIMGATKLTGSKVLATPLSTWCLVGGDIKDGTSTRNRSSSEARTDQLLAR